MGNVVDDRVRAARGSAAEQDRTDRDCVSIV